MTFQDNSSDLLNSLYLPRFGLPQNPQSSGGLGRYAGMYGGGSYPAGGLAMPNVPPPMLNYGQAGLLGVPQQTLGGASLPVLPTPPSNQNRQSPTDAPPSSTAQPETNDPEGDFLKVVRDTTGGIVRGALDFIGIPNYVVAQPAYMMLLHRDEAIGKLLEGAVKGKNPWETINEAFEESPDPGVAKFVGATVLDPLTYVGGLGLAAKAARVPVVGAKLAKGIDVAGAPFRAIDRAVERTGEAVGPTLNSIMNNNLDLVPVKDYIRQWTADAAEFQASQNAARQILGKILPGGTVENILNTLPDTYTGLSISRISDPLNSAFPKLGLPPVLAFPEVRILTISHARDIARTATNNTFATRKIDPTMAFSTQNQVRDAIDSIYSATPGSLPQHERQFQALIKEPLTMGRTQFNMLSRLLDGSVRDPNSMQLRELNSIVDQFRRGPQVDPLGGLDEQTAVQAIGQLVGADLRNPDTSYSISKFLQARTDESRLYRQKLGKMTPGEILDEVTNRAGNKAKADWDLRIKAERDQQTYFGMALDRFDRVYTHVYKNLIATEINGPIAKSQLGFGMFVPMNLLETRVRQFLSGGGVSFNTLSHENFNRLFAYFPNVPPRLMQYSPGERRAANAGSVLSESVTGFYGAGHGPLARIVDSRLNPFNWLLEKGNDLEVGMQRDAYWNFFRHSLDQEMSASGLVARTDMGPFMAAARSPDAATDPLLAGLDQGLLNSIAENAIANVSDPASYDSMVAAINAGFFNRERLAAAIDADASIVGQIHPLTKDIWTRGVRGVEPNSEEFKKIIDRMIEQEKRFADSDPEVIHQKFMGMTGHIIRRAQDPNSTASDLQWAMNQFHALQSQFSDLPQAMRQGEWQSIQHVMGETQGVWRRKLHEEWNDKFQESLNKVGSQLEQANEHMLTMADKFGLRPEMERVTDVLRADQQLTIDTWLKDLEFQSEFFKNNRIGKKVTNLEAYYTGREAIWGDYYGQRALLSTQLRTESAVMGDRIVQMRIQEAAAKLVAAGGERQWTQTARSAGSITGTYGPHTIQITRSTGRNWTYAIDGQAATETFKSAEMARSAAINNADVNLAANVFRTGEPGIDAIADQIAEGFRRGNDHDHILSDIRYNETAATARTTGGQSGPIIGHNTSGEPIPPSRPDQPIGAGVNGSSGATVDYANNGPIANAYAAADSLRPRLEELIRNTMNNPAMTDDNVRGITNWMDKLRNEFNSLDVADRNTLSEVKLRAVDRATKLFNNSYVDYDGRNKFDWLMQHMFPFWMYESRRWPYLFKQMVNKPAAAEMYNRYVEQTDQGYIPLGEIPFEINPLRGTVFGAISNAGDPDRPLKYTHGVEAALESVNATLAKFGLYFGPYISIPVDAISGRAGNTLPPIGQLVLHGADASGLPVLSDVAGKMQDLLPDPFKDYYTRMILASMPIKETPDQIYRAAADDPNSREAQILDGAVKQSDLVSIVLRQTGFLRFRTPEYMEYRQARQQAIWEVAGMSPAEQDRLSQEGKSVYQITSISPEQQDILAQVPGSKSFNQISQPLLNPQAARFRQQQREYYDTIAKVRTEELQKQLADDDLFRTGAISGKQWRDRYQARQTTVANLGPNLKLSPEYKNVPITPEEQAAARKRFNLPAYVEDPISIGLNLYYSIEPETDITGEVNWSKFFEQREQFLAKNPSIAAEIDRKSKENDTFQVQAFKQAAKILRPYFGLSDEIAKRYPQLQSAQDVYEQMKNVNPLLAASYRDNNGAIQMLSRMISQAREAARKQFPQIDAALVQYYGATPISYQELDSKSSLPAGIGKFAGMYGVKR